MLWKEVLVKVNWLKEHHQPPEKMELDSIVEEESDGNQLVDSVRNASLESMVTPLVKYVTMVMERATAVHPSKQEAPANCCNSTFVLIWW